MKRLLLCWTLMLASSAWSQTLPTTTDHDANGRSIVHLGAAATGFMYMKSDCTEELARGFKCTVIRPAPALTEFQYDDLVSIRIPGRSAHSLLCFDITPLIDVGFENTMGSRVTNAVFSGYATLTIKSRVLNDPSLIRPWTGQPYNGELTIPTVQYSETLELDAGERNRRSYHLTRSCGSASISKEALIESFGFSEAQANSFFNSTITVELGARALTRHASDLLYQYHVRLYGDRR